nr:MAG TPA: hypothetical protein [Caudoviricetes sp.]
MVGSLSAVGMAAPLSHRLTAILVTPSRRASPYWLTPRASRSSRMRNLVNSCHVLSLDFA